MNNCLDQSLGRKLILVSAPAGSGKTTLLGEWVSQVGVPVGWLSLDERDNDPVRLLSYVIAVLQTTGPNIGETALAMLQSPQPPSVGSVLPTLVNDIAERQDRIVLILDDYHVIESQAVHDALTFLLDHLPPQLQLVISSRMDPPWSLSCLRANGQVNELRSADLRFTPEESADFLNQVMALNLSGTDIAALDRRTEGWIAGLQLAALSMQELTEQSRQKFVSAFAGSHRLVTDYLVDEVFHHQPEHIQSFLLQTSILDRLFGSLCNVVTLRDDGQSVLERLERANLFLVPLDDERRW